MDELKEYLSFPAQYGRDIPKMQNAAKAHSRRS